MIDDLTVILDRVRQQIEAARARGVPDAVIRATLLRSIAANQRKLAAIRALVDLLLDGMWSDDTLGEA